MIDKTNLFVFKNRQTIILIYLVHQSIDTLEDHLSLENIFIGLFTNDQYILI